MSGSSAVASSVPAPGLEVDEQPRPPFVVVPGPAESVPRDVSARVGGMLALVGVLLDPLIVAVTTGVLARWLFGAGNGQYTTAVTAVAVLSALLLLPTHRRGRTILRPSELMGTIASRLALAVVVVYQFLVIQPIDLLELPKESLQRLANLGVPMTVWVGSFAGVMLGRVVMFKVIHMVRSRGFDLEEVLIVGAGPVGCAIAEAIDQNPECGLATVGFLDRFDERLDHPILGRPDDLVEILEETGISEVILAFGAASESEVVGIVRQASHLPVQFYAVPRFFELGVATSPRGFEVDGLALTPLGRPGRHHRMWPLKRAFDISVSSFLLLVSAPLFLMCAAAVKATSRGPIFFRQERVSVGDVPFDILKFRTMRYVADPEEQARLDRRAQAVNLDDDRITPVGKFLRNSHLDELPQLLNVLRGDMSIVGPRPERPYWVDQHTTEVEGYRYRHRVPAGITGWAQVNGFWGDSSIETRVRLDNRYIENWSLWRDIVIGLRTIPTLLGKRR